MQDAKRSLCKKMYKREAEQHQKFLDQKVWREQKEADRFDKFSVATYLGISVKKLDRLSHYDFIRSSLPPKHRRHKPCYSRYHVLKLLFYMSLRSLGIEGRVCDMAVMITDDHCKDLLHEYMGNDGASEAGGLADIFNLFASKYACFTDSNRKASSSVYYLDTAEGPSKLSRDVFLAEYKDGFPAYVTVFMSAMLRDVVFMQ